MKLQRFFIQPGAMAGNQITVTDRDILSQIRKVLRMKVGDRVIFMDGAGREYEAEISEFDAATLKAAVLKEADNVNEPDLKIFVYQALCKKDKFEWILQKGTEVGVTEFLPVLADRSEKLGLNFERGGKILKEAAEQSERGIIPKLGEIVKFEDALKSAKGERIILDKSGEDIRNFNPQVPGSGVSIFIGPEGGWTDDELDLARKSGARILSLGARVLRTETAGLVAAAILINKV